MLVATSTKNLCMSSGCWGEKFEQATEKRDNRSISYNPTFLESDPGLLRIFANTSKS